LTTQYTSARLRTEAFTQADLRQARSGYELTSDTALPDSVIRWIAKRVQSDAVAWSENGDLDKTRTEHMHDLRAYVATSTETVRIAAFHMREVLDIDILALATEGTAFCGRCGLCQPEQYRAKQL
jgi:hypothetical protein